MTRKRLSQWGAFALVVGVLLWQASLPAWRQHLETDAAVFAARATHFLSSGSWADLGRNEYQPGALWFFVIIGGLTFAALQTVTFSTVLIGVNVILLVGHYAYLLRFGHRTAPWIFLILAVATGPILLFRFELLVTALIIATWHSLRRQQEVRSSVLLGLATAIKVYPLILVPLLLLNPLRRRQYQRVIHLLAAYVVGGALPLVLWLATGGTLSTAVAGLQFHQLKPVSLEGLWGSVIMLAQTSAHLPLIITPGYGVHGFTPTLPFLTDELLNNSWLVPVALIYLYILWRYRTRPHNGQWELPLLITCVFVLAAKVLNPQYLWWWFAVLPLVPERWLRQSGGQLIVVSSATAAILTQLIYPLYYTEFLHWFVEPTSPPWLFALVLVRNLLLVITAILIIYQLRANADAADDATPVGVTP